MIMRSGRLFALVWAVIFIITEFLVSELSKRGYINPTLKKLAPLEAMDEFVGRSAEMGKPVHFTTGYAGGWGVGDRAIMAGLGILQIVAEKCAKIGVPLINTIAYGELLPIADEAMRTGGIMAGEPDWYNPSMNRFIAQEGHSYALGVVETLESERPGASFAIGNFWSEALLITESGARLGIPQISGCQEYSAMPFLIASTDYVLLSPEMYNAQAYVKKDNVLTGAIAGEDMIGWFVLIQVFLALILIPVGINLLSIMRSW
mgnify:CR=1 FL=1